MFYKKPNLPDESEFVLCTVKNVSFHSVFVTLDEYEKLEGMIHISEISPGRIRNIRDFVKEGKKIVCKVLRINKENRHVDLSLRRVSASIRKKKNTEYKQEQKAEKMLEIVAKKLKTSLEDVYKKAGYNLMEKYGSLYDSFLLIIKDEIDPKDLNIPSKYLSAIIETIKEKVKPPEVSIQKTLNISNISSNGIELIKGSLKKACDLAKKNKYSIDIKYISAPRYSLTALASDYKTAELIVKQISEFIIEDIKKQNGRVEISK